MDASTCPFTELDEDEMRSTAGGARIWRPSGYTPQGDPIYEWVDV